MRILLITGSPRKKGTTALLADKFTEGALAAGHRVDRFDAAFARVSPCKACMYCRKHDGVCVQKDDMAPLTGRDGLILQADVLAFATPLYYFDMSAQIKTALDRFYAVNRLLKERPAKAVLLAASGDAQDWTMDGLTTHFRTVCRWTGWEDGGQVLALGCHERAELEASPYPAQAYELGKRL